MSSVTCNTLLLVAIIYVVKFLIGRLPASAARVYFFVLLVAASLPYIWVLVVMNWTNPHVYRIACWIHDPVGLWLIPAGSFAADTLAGHGPSLRWYSCRSCLECLLMVPWWYAWALISFFFLGDGWI